MSLLDDATSSLAAKLDASNISADQLLTVLAKPISDKLNQKIDLYAQLARTKIAKERGVKESYVTDLDVAEYLSGMPTARLSGDISNKMEYIGKAVSAGVVVGCIFIAISILVGSKKNHG